MRISRLLLSFGLCVLLVIPSAGQQPASSSTQASQLLRQSLAALQGNMSLTDVTLSGTARRIAGSDNETGRAIVKGLASGAARIDLSLSSGRGFAQHAIISPPGTPHYGTYTLSGGFWRVDGGFVSTLRIKNNLVVAPLQVIPTLYMADGTAYPLPPITLAVGGVTSLNINDALFQAAASIPGHISDFGTVELIYQYSSAGHVMAFVQALDVPRSLSLEWPLMEEMTPIHGVSDTMPAPGPQTVEGLWWKHDAGVSGSVLLTNTTADEQSVTVQLTGSAGKPIQPMNIQLGPHATNQLALDSLALGTGLLEHGAGGVRIQYNGEMDAVVVGGGLLNPSEGYSANIPFWWHDLSSEAAPRRYASAGLMVGKPDPALGFPVETTFSPYLALRNTTAVPLELAIELNYMQGNTPVSRTVPAALGAGEARQIKLVGLMAALGINGLNGSINVGVSFSGCAGDLVIANGSVDQTGTYVFEVKPQPVTSALRRIGDHWSTASGNDTMLSLWNPTSQSEDVEVTFLYSDGSGEYVMDFHLAPGASAALDLKQLIAAGVPDKNGNRIPAGVQEGSVMLANAQEPAKPLTLVVDLAVYNVADATCCGQCTNCCGFSTFVVSPGSFTMNVGSQMQCTCTAQDCTGRTYTLSGTWSSSNASVMTVNSTSGLVTGVSVGTGNISVDLGFVGVGSGCIPNGCPVSHQTPGTSGTVVSLQITDADIENNNVNVTLSAPSGLSNVLTVTANGSSNNVQVSANSGNAVGSGQYTVSFNRPTMPADTYTQITAAWGETSKTLALSRKWSVLGLFRHSQYNTPYESSCTGTPQTAWVFNAQCTFTQVNLRSDFVSQVYVNGSGISQQNGAVQYNNGSLCSGSYPTGANTQNSFLGVSAITGSCGTSAVGGSTVAAYPNPAVVGGTYVCGDNILEVTSSNTNNALKTANDYCPACSAGFNGTLGHIDDYSSSQACSAHAVGDLGNFWTADTH